MYTAKGQTYADHFFLFIVTLKNIRWLIFFSCVVLRIDITPCCAKGLKIEVVPFSSMGAFCAVGTEHRYCQLLAPK